MPNNSRRRNRRTRKQPFVTKSVLHNDLFGRVMRPPDDPRAYVSSPWNTVVVYGNGAAGAVGWSNWDVNSFRTAIRRQVGLQDTDPLDVRVQWVCLYQVTQFTAVPPPSSTKPWDRTLAIQWMNFINGTTLHTTEDIGTPTRFARVGYEWPKNYQMYSIKNSDNPTLFQHDVGVAGGYGYIYLARFLWRISTYDPNPTSTVMLTTARPYHRFATSSDQVQMELSDAISEPFEHLTL